MAGSKEKSLILQNDCVTVNFEVDENGRIFLRDVLPAGATRRPSASKYFEDQSLHFIQARLAGEGNPTFKTSKALVGTGIGERLVYVSHEKRRDEQSGSTILDIELTDKTSGVDVVAHVSIFDGLPILRCSCTIKNVSEKDIVITQISSLAIGGMANAKEWWHDYQVSIANNTWFREAQWVDMSLPSIGVDDTGLYEIADPHVASMQFFSLSNGSTFSTQGHLPMGVLKRVDDTETWLWQIESNGPWRWEIGEYKDNLYLAAGGAISNDHGWRHSLAPGETFTSPPVAMCHVYGTQESAFQALTKYRRVIIRKHQDHQKLPIIFNDYMNCLAGDPTDEKILALADPAAKAGAEYFVIDAGWYSDDKDWWDDVGLWEPSTKRFPMGFDKLLETLKKKNLIPGLWIEPEVIGARSVMAKVLPDDAFFQRNGVRVVEKSRYHLDYRHPAVIKRMNEVVDNLVQTYGVGYFKFDYNIEVMEGTDVNASSPGSGFVGHMRAYLQWIESLLDRYPGLVMEHCSSGAQRMDYGMLSVNTLQSTSDQQDPVRYAAISAAIHTAVVPEQGASWAYPQGDWSDEINALTVVNSLLGRIHLSGRLDLMNAKQLQIIEEGMEVYRGIRSDIPSAVPFWPLGLSKWHDKWLAVGLMPEHQKYAYLAVWRRGGGEDCSLPILHLQDRKDVDVELLYPRTFPSEASWDQLSSSVKVHLSPSICARLYKIAPH